MDQTVYQKIDKFSNALAVGDVLEICGTHAKIDKISTNDHDDLVLHLTIIKATFKRRSKMMLILPKKLLVITLK